MSNQHLSPLMLVAAVRAGIAIDPDEPTDVMVTLERNARAALDSLFEQYAALEREADNLTERLEKRLDEDSVYRVYDEQVAENQRLKEQLEALENVELMEALHEVKRLREQLEALEAQAESGSVTVKMLMSELERTREALASLVNEAQKHRVDVWCGEYDAAVTQARVVLSSDAETELEEEAVTKPWRKFT